MLCPPERTTKYEKEENGQAHRAKKGKKQIEKIYICKKNWGDRKKSLNTWYQFAHRTNLITTLIMTLLKVE